jgi:ribonuclease-3
MKESEDRLDELEERLGVTFSDKGLLEQALTHRSMQGQGDMSGETNERLEFLGDAVLGVVVANHLYRQFPEYTEGELTKMKAVVVSEVSLSEIARQLGIGEFLRVAKGEDASGGRERPSILADAMEALIGAVYVDQGPEAARGLILRVLKGALRAVYSKEYHKDYKTVLQEILQERHKAPPQYNTVAETGPDHEKTFVVEARFGDQILGVGSGKSKKEAEQAAAKEALDSLPDF